MWLLDIGVMCNFYQGSFAILKGTEGNNVPAQSSDSTEAKLKDFAGKMVGLKVSLSLLFVFAFCKRHALFYMK